MEVNITVLDVNDNSPSFTMEPYIVMINENNVSPGGGIAVIQFLRITATDADEPGPNSIIRYSITAGDPNGFFEINANNV